MSENTEKKTQKVSKTNFPEFDCFGNKIIRFDGKKKTESSIVNGKKLVLENGDLKVIETDKVDTQKLIESEAHNAGLENIKKMAALRYGTLGNALAVNQDRQTFADVSNIPVGNPQAQAEYIEAQRDKLAQQAASLGVSVDELLKMTEATYNALMQQRAAAAAAANSNQQEEGGSK